MTDNRETIEMLKTLKEQALKSHNDTAVLEVKIDSFNFVLDEAIKALEKTGWIPVNERLPEDCQRVLVTVVRYNGNSIVRVAEYYSRNNGKGIFQIQENHDEWEVGEKGLLAWMPLPEPYKEVSK